MRTLLVPFHGSDATQSALEMAHLVATRFGSYIEGLFVLQPPPIIAGEGITIPGEYLTQLAEERRRLADGARERFEKFMNERDVPLQDITVAGDKPSANWRELEGLESQIIGEYGRLFDLIVVGCATQPSSADRNATCEAALFESGRPVMISTENTPTTLGKTIVIAWNGSTETARTIAEHQRHGRFLGVGHCNVHGPVLIEVADHRHPELRGGEKTSMESADIFDLYRLEALDLLLHRRLVANVFLRVRTQR
ncbi:MAG: universal stress protein, partial [Proteobacteria bacterium]|nr:universal stress protein [Pseudomonadota bacterium]